MERQYVGIDLHRRRSGSRQRRPPTTLGHVEPDMVVSHQAGEHRGEELKPLATLPRLIAASLVVTSGTSPVPAYGGVSVDDPSVADVSRVIVVHREPSVAGVSVTLDQLRTQDPHYQAQLRAKFGLSQDLGHIQALLSDPAPVVSYGMALTRAEADEITRQLEISEQLDEADAEVRRVTGDSYAGVEFDHSTGGTTIFYTTDLGLVKAVIEEARRVLPAGAVVVVKHVKYSEADLNAVREKLRSAADVSMAISGVRVTGLSLNPTTNTVDLKAPSGQDFQALAPIVEGLPVRVVVDELRGALGSRCAAGLHIGLPLRDSHWIEALTCRTCLQDLSSSQRCA